jgi:hypothetical protein
MIPCRLTLARSDKKGEKVVRLGFIKVIDVARALAPNVGDLAYGFAETTRYSVNMLQRNLCRIQRALIIAVMVPSFIFTGIF